MTIDHQTRNKRAGKRVFCLVKDCAPCIRGCVDLQLLSTPGKHVLKHRCGTIVPPLTIIVHGGAKHPSVQMVTEEGGRTVGPVLMRPHATLMGYILPINLHRT